MARLTEPRSQMSARTCLTGMPSKAVKDERGRTAPEIPTSSQPSIVDFISVYQQLLDSGSDIVSIHLAGGMSGTVSSAEQARAALGDQAQRVQVVDSASACGGQGLVVLAAAAA